MPFTSETAKIYGFKKGNRARLGSKNSDKQKEAVRKYMKNRVVLEETKKKISKFLSGRKNPFLGNYSKSLKGTKHFNFGRERDDMAGSNNNNWKGGVTSRNRLERVRFKQIMQKSIFERDGYKCFICKKGGDLQVEHIQKWSEKPEMRFIMSNCVTLCKQCHYLRTFGRPMVDPKMPWGHNLGRRVA